MTRPRGVTAVITGSVSHLANRTVYGDLVAICRRDRATTAEMLVYIGEFDTRQLYRGAGFESTYEFCVTELGMSEDEACRRIQAARAGRRFPAIFEAVADGRLHLTAVNLLAKHLTEETATELLAAATRKTKKEIELLLAQRYPRPDLAARMWALPGSPTAPLRAEASAPDHMERPARGRKVVPSPRREADSGGTKPPRSRVDASGARAAYERSRS